MLTKQFLIFLSVVKRPLNLLADSQAAIGCCITSWGQSHYELHAQNWENNLIYHVTIPVIICAPKALSFHPLLQMFLRLKVLANSYLWTARHDSLDNLPIKLNILSVLGVKSSFKEQGVMNHLYDNKEIPSCLLCPLTYISKQDRRMKNTWVLTGLL